MPRVKRGKTHVARRKRLLKRTKGYKAGRKKLIKAAKTAVNKAGVHAYRGRKLKKRTNRSLWQVQINAACRENGINYSSFINLLKKNKIDLDRKVLAEMANKTPKAFITLVKKVKK